MANTVTSVKIDDGLWKALKIAAIREDRDISTLNSEAIKDWLQKHKYQVVP